VTPQELFSSQLTLIESVIGFIARRHRLSAAEAEEFGSIAKLRLIENDYRILAQFQQRSSLRTFLGVVIDRLFLDERTARWGKWRPSAEARRIGPLAVRLETLLARDGLSFDEACQMLRTNHRVTETEHDLYAILEHLPIRVASRRVDRASSAPPTGADADGVVRSAEAERTMTALERALTRLQPLDRLIIKFLFFDRLTVAEIARAQGLDQRVLYRQKDRLLHQLRDDLESQGVSREDVAFWLEGAPALEPRALFDADVTSKLDARGPSV
jgi:RNA polymerase sigma factor for flagellar operon FliA